MQLPDGAPLLAATVAAHRGLAMDELVDRVLGRLGLEILADSIKLAALVMARR